MHSQPQSGLTPGHACDAPQNDPVTAEQRAALLAALQDWDAWLTARETEAAPGYIVYRPAGDEQNCVPWAELVMSCLGREAPDRLDRVHASSGCMSAAHWPSEYPLHSSYHAHAPKLYGCHAGSGPNDKSGAKGVQAAPPAAAEEDEAAPASQEVSSAARLFKCAQEPCEMGNGNVMQAKHGPHPRLVLARPLRCQAGCLKCQSSWLPSQPFCGCGITRPQRRATQTRCSSSSTRCR